MWIRQIHRWLSIAFTLAVIANIVAMIQQVEAAWIGFLALVPLIPMLITGLYLFALPYLGKRDDVRREAGS
jgi:archaellum biogenesis protein FlaJ (TadC family)